jgi:hypothetical protein
MQHSISIYKKMTVDGNWMWKRNQTNPWLLCLWPTLLLTCYKNNKERELVLIFLHGCDYKIHVRDTSCSVSIDPLPPSSNISLQWSREILFSFSFFVFWIAKSPSSPFLEVHWWSTHTMYTLAHSMKHCTRIPPSSNWFALFAAGSGWIY